MTIVRYIICSTLLLLCPLSCWAERYATVRTAAPVMTRPDFTAIFGGRDHASLKTDRCGQVRELEFIALPGTVFRILGELKEETATVYRASTAEYSTPPGRALYLESRFVELLDHRPPERQRTLPPREAILSSLKAALGSPYVWGGNLQEGIPEMMSWFYRSSNISDKRLSLAGLDCSGLLYQATRGWTPRNTAQLVSFGAAVAIGGKTAETIAAQLEPLDLVVWNGHVLIVLDRENIIESRLICGGKGNGGVVITPLGERLREIMRTRRPVDRWPVEGKQYVFVVRRWYP